MKSLIHGIGGVACYAAQALVAFWPVSLALVAFFIWSVIRQFIRIGRLSPAALFSLALIPVGWLVIALLVVVFYAEPAAHPASRKPYLYLINGVSLALFVGWGIC